MKENMGKFRQILLITLLFAAPALAKQFEGYVQICERNHLCLRMTGTNNTHVVWGANLGVRNTLKKLTVGDYFVANGEFLSEGRGIRVDNINFVGLGELLGPWRDKLGQIFDFVDFQRLDYYGFDAQAYANGTPEKSWSYSLAPAPGNDWTLFLLDDSVHIGRLDQFEDEMVIRFIEPRTGRVQRVLELFPVK